MIKNEEILRHTLEQIARLYKAIHLLHKDVPNEDAFLVLAEGPLDMLQEMESDVANYMRTMHGITDTLRDLGYLRDSRTVAAVGTEVLLPEHARELPRQGA